VLVLVLCTAGETVLSWCCAVAWIVGFLSQLVNRCFSAAVPVLELWSCGCGAVTGAVELWLVPAHKNARHRRR